MQSVDKKYFLFNKGLNTEAPLVAWPEGFTIDERNFDLLQDGSRRRRKGLALEQNATNVTLPIPTASTGRNSGTCVYRWRNVNNRDDLSFVIIQIGAALYLWNDPKTGPLGRYSHALDLSSFKVTFNDPVTADGFTASDEQLSMMQVSMAEVNGKLVVVGKYIEPVLISYNGTDFVAGAIPIKERDMFGIDDGVDMDVMPVTLSDEHRYNLFSRGWLEDNIEEFFDEKTVYPSKNMIHFMGMRRQTETGYSDDDGIKVFSPDKLYNELFQNMSAPQGHITRSVFNWRTGYGSLGQAEVIKTIASATCAPAQSLLTITCADPDHEVALGNEIDISGIVIVMRTAIGNTKRITIEGDFRVTSIISQTSFTVSVPSSLVPTNWTYKSTESLGQYGINGVITAEFTGFEPMETRFSQVASFAGRIFYGGCPDTRISDRLYFSKIIESDKDFGQCYQEADPTSEFISDLIPTDGGYITLPNLGTLKALVPYGNALLCFSTEGVWAVGPGEGLFSAIGYTVRKITDAECIADKSVIVAVNIPF